MKTILAILKCFLGFGTVADGSVCEASSVTGIDFHDYPIEKGGDGIPSHFHTYQCSKCSKPFII